QGTTDANGQVSVSLVSTTVGAATLVSTLADGTTASVNTLAFVAVAATDPAPAAPATETIVQTVEADLDAFAAKLKSVLLLAGHDVESVFAEAVALAKKL
ncbi:hypothetical protein, partial [Martelella alba]|uniref:hypothetical protein n=1 Tax=Martelella alba TaxID=2590451 RepID=UPI001E317408